MSSSEETPPSPPRRGHLNSYNNNVSGWGCRCVWVPTGACWEPVKPSQEHPLEVDYPEARTTSVLFSFLTRGKIPATDCRSSLATVIILPGGPPLWLGLLSTLNKLYFTFIPTLVGNYGTLQPYSRYQTPKHRQGRKNGEIRLLPLYERHPNPPSGPIQEITPASN